MYLFTSNKKSFKTNASSSFTRFSFGAFLKAFCSVVLLTSLLACSGGGNKAKQEVKTTGNIVITGAIKDSSSGDSIAGAKVFLDGNDKNSVLSNDAGTFRFEVELSVGNHSISATKGNYRSESKNFTTSSVKDGTINVGILIMDLKSRVVRTSLSGYVSDSITGDKLKGVSIDIADQKTTTNDEGYYKISSLIPNTYQLTAVRQNYKNFEESVSVIKNTNNKFNIKMIPIEQNNYLSVSSTDPKESSTIGINQGITVNFNDKILANQESLVILRDNLKAKVEFTLAITGTEVLIKPKQALKPDHAYTLTIAQGLRAQNAKPLQQNFLLNFKTTALSFNIKLSKATAYSGDSIDFEAEVIKGNITSYQWKSDKDGVLSTDAKFSKVLSVGKHSITLTVKDDTDNTYTKTASLEIKKTSFTIKASKTSAIKGDSIAFSVQNLLGTAVSFKWSSSLDGVLSTQKSFSKDDLSIGSHTITLTVNDGNDDITATVTVVINKPDAKAPSKPANIKFTIASSSSVQLSWDASSDADGSITGYWYAYKKSSDADYSTEVEEKTTKLTLTGLSLDTSYDFRVRAKDNDTDSGGLFSDYASLSITIKRFTKAKGIVTDIQHNLLWQNTAANDAQYSNAANYCSSLNLDAKTSWRLPTRAEFANILDHTAQFDSVSATVEYWTSEEDASNINNAWAIKLASGTSATSMSKRTNNKVKCVRANN